jgi:hypothetical protein
VPLSDLILCVVAGVSYWSVTIVGRHVLDETKALSLKPMLLVAKGCVQLVSAPQHPPS